MYTIQSRGDSLFDITSHRIHSDPASKCRHPFIRLDKRYTSSRERKGMRFAGFRRLSEVVTRARMSGSVPPEVVVAEAKKQSFFATLQNYLRWSPTSRQDIIESEQRLLSQLK